MLGKFSTLFASLSVLAIVGAVQAATITLYPWSPEVAPGGVVGNTSTFAPNFDKGSFQANATPASGNKSEIYVDPASLFGHSITVGDIQNMSYYTNKAGDAGSVDWSLNIYTTPGTGTGPDTGGFYHSHLSSEPYFTQTPNASDPSNQWHQWSTNNGSNSLIFYDQKRSGNFGTYTDPTLISIQAYGANGNNYDNETVKYLSFQTGSAWGSGFSGLLDGFNISLQGAYAGQTGAINFEAVPLPSSVWAGLLLMAGYGATRLRRKNAIA